MPVDAVLTWLLVLITALFAAFLLGGVAMTAYEDVLTTRAQRRLLERQHAVAAPAAPAAPRAHTVIHEVGAAHAATSGRWGGFGGRRKPAVALAPTAAQAGLVKYVVESAGFSVN